MTIKFIKRTSRILIITCLLLVTFSSYSQVEAPEVKRSNNKVNIEGVNYYMHIVRKGENLFAISRAYNVPADSIKKDNQLILKDGLQPNQYLKLRIIENKNNTQQFVYHTVAKGDTPYSISKKYNASINSIYECNPNSDLGIKIGQILKIPVASSTYTAVSNITMADKINNKPSDIIENEGFIIHIVGKKETLYGISAKHETTVEEIKKNNPNIINREIQIGESLKIPVDNNTATDDEYYIHQVKKQETVWGICQMYDIKTKQLNKINPEIEVVGLQEDMYIKIPKNRTSDAIFTNTASTEIIPPSVTVDTSTIVNVVIEDTTKIITPVSITEFNKTNKYKVAFFLPMYCNLADSIITDESESSKETSLNSQSKIFIEFYEGALLALNNLRNQGVSLDIHFFDTQNDSLKVAKILKTPGLSDFDLFIGPVFSTNLDMVGDFAWEHQINIVSPLSIKSNFIEHNPYAFQVSPPFEIQMKHASEFLNNMDSKNFIVIHDGNNSNQEYISTFKQQLFAQINSENFDQIKYNEVHYYSAKDSVLKNVFSPNIKNIVIVPSQNRAFVSDIIGKLNGYSYKYDIVTFGQPRWLSFENIELDNFHNTNTHIFSNSYIDYEDETVKDFVRQYRKNFSTEPSKYAFQGYDITYYFCSALNIYGNSFRHSIHLHHPKSLQTNFDFVPYTDQGGYLNSSIYILEFTDDFLLKKVASYPN